MNTWQSLKTNLASKDMMTKIIVVNIAIFLVINVVGSLSHLNLLPYFGLPIGGFGFLFKFWTLFTYMFSHANLGHIFFNMLLFYFTAQLFYQIMGERTLLYIYVMSGLCGGVLLVLLGMFFQPVFTASILIGASAAVMGLVMVIAAYAPNYPVYLFGIIQMRYKYFAFFVFVLSTILDLAVNTGGKVSHIGGAAFGLVYGLNLRNGKELFNFTFLTRKKSKLKIVSYQTVDDSYNTKKISEEEELNELLDKISKSGYDSLTKKEKETLFKASQKK